MTAELAELSVGNHPVVLRLGGSLLDVPDLGERLWNFVSQWQTEGVLIVPGGGFAADTIRELDQRCRLTAHQAHWMAIAAMSWNAGLLSRLDRRYVLVSDRCEAREAWSSARVPILDTMRFLQRETERDPARVRELPESWEITSDSLSAWICRNWPGRRLILAKSCDPGAGTWRDHGERGLVDRGFAVQSAGLPVEWLNLRN